MSDPRIKIAGRHTYPPAETIKAVVRPSTKLAHGIVAEEIPTELLRTNTRKDESGVMHISATGGRPPIQRYHKGLQYYQDAERMAREAASESQREVWALRKELELAKKAAKAKGLAAIKAELEEVRAENAELIAERDRLRMELNAKEWEAAAPKTGASR